MAVFGDISVTASAVPGTSVWTGGASEITVRNTGSVNAYLNVVGVHAPEEWYAIEASLSETFKAKQNGITAIFAYSASTGTLRVMKNAADVLA